MPFYLGELTEKVEQDDRIQILKASHAKLKVNVVHILNHLSYLLVNIASGDQNTCVATVLFEVFGVLQQ